MKTKRDIEVLMDSIFKELQVTREAGQKEYAHDTENAFGNFERLAIELQMSREKVLWVYVKKHLDGIVSYINGHRSQREDVRGRIKDVMVYLVLLWGMVDDAEQILIGFPGKVFTIQDNVKQYETATETLMHAEEPLRMNEVTKFHNEHIESIGAKKKKFFKLDEEFPIKDMCSNCGLHAMEHKYITADLKECPI